MTLLGLPEDRKFVIGEDRPTLDPSLEVGISERLGAHGMEKRRKLLKGKRAEVLS